MRTHTSRVTASLLGTMVLLLCQTALAQGSERQLQGFGVERMAAPAVLFSPPLEPGWWRAIKSAIDAMRGLRGRRISPVAARQVDLHLGSERMERPIRWQDLSRIAPLSPDQLELRFGPVCGMPVQIEPFTASVVDSRGASGELLGAWATLPWPVPEVRQLQASCHLSDL